MDIEYLIYIIVGIVWLIQTWYKKQQKAKKGSTDSSKKPTEEGSIKSILEEILLGPQRTQTPIPVEMEDDYSVNIPTPKTSYVAPQEVKEIPKEKAKFVVENKSSLLSIKKGNHLQEEEEGLPIEIDLKQAVIHSEILNRPVY